MNFFQILSEIEKVDPEVYDRLDSRRRVFKHMAGVGQKLTAAALPLFVGSVFNKVYAQTPAGLGVNDVLNFALKLEYLEMYFYAQANRAGLTTLSSVNANSLALIGTDEANHVAFLRTVLGTNAIAAVASTEFDFSGARLAYSNNTAGPFADWRSNANTYLALAQAFEDTGVRAYKGAAPLTAVMANKTVLTAALNIHSIEARHASHIRSMRRGGATSATPSNSASTGTYTSSPKSWIAGNDGGGPVPMYTAPVYNAGNDSGAATYGASNQVGTAITPPVTFLSEANNTQGGVPLSSTTISAITFPTGSLAFSEAFDEGLDVKTVATIANGFTVAGSQVFSVYL